MINKIEMKIAIKDYYGKGKHVYEDEMGFRDRMKSEARSLVAREVFRYHVEEVGLNLGASIILPLIHSTEFSLK